MRTLGGGKNEAITGKDKKQPSQLFPIWQSGDQAWWSRGGGGAVAGLGGKWRAEEVGGLLFRWEHSWSKIHEFKPRLPRQGCLLLSPYTVFTKSNSKWLNI